MKDGGQNSASWNRLAHWFGPMEALKRAAGLACGTT
jgi:hypothetical protein